MASYTFRETRPFTKDRPLTERTGLSQGGQASHKNAGPLTGRPVLSKGGRASNREARPPIGRLGLQQGGQSSHRVLITYKKYL